MNLEWRVEMVGKIARDSKWVVVEAQTSEEALSIAAGQFPNYRTIGADVVLYSAKVGEDGKMRIVASTDGQEWDAALQAHMQKDAAIKKENLRTELASLLNRHRQVKRSGTPAFILADYLLDCLEAWNRGMKLRSKWYQGSTETEN